jgi:hypothetical protein
MTRGEKRGHRSRRCPCAALHGSSGSDGEVEQRKLAWVIWKASFKKELCVKVLEFKNKP